MDLREYQKLALETDQVPDADCNGLIVPLLGLAGEAGELLSEYKKHLRDRDAHRLFKERISEELGDLLWYLANAASKFDLDLADIAVANLLKCKARWTGTTTGQAGPSGTAYVFDDGFPEAERLQRQLDVELRDIRNGDSVKTRAFVNGEQVGDNLTDNAYGNDGYRFHDVFHLAYAAVLGWSPVMRRNLKRKRKSDSAVDEVEDGGRARVIEEGISGLVFAYAQKHNFLDGIKRLDYELLRSIKMMTSHLEVSRCSAADWETAILRGYAVWREVLRHGGGRIHVNLDKRMIQYAGNP